MEYFLYFFPVLVIAITLHEFAHCWAHEALGDDTPRQEGRMTLNPLAHLDLMGTIMMVAAAFSGVGIGWGKPAPFNPRNFRNPARDNMLSALAGPASNILQMLGWMSLGALVSTLDHTQPFVGTLTILCFYGTIINAGLAVFNMIPIAPLDGHWVLAYFLPPSWRPAMSHPAWGVVFLALIFIPQLRDQVLHPLIRPVQQGITVTAAHLTGWPPVEIVERMFHR
jgi:Zn-dependent protease